MYISKKCLEKLQKHLCRGIFRESCGITYHSSLKIHSLIKILLEVQNRCFTRNLTKMLFAELKDKENSYDDNEGKLALQTIVIELYK